MSESAARGFLAGLRRAVRNVGLYPRQHPISDEALASATEAADGLTRIGGGESALSIYDDAFYLASQVLPHSSLEFNGLLREMQKRGIESLTLMSPVSVADLADLAAFVAGASGDIPADGTIRLNERPFTPMDLESAAAMSGLRRSYARSLDVLRAIATAVRTGHDFDLTGVSWAVENLVEQTLAQPAASLLLATVKSHDEYTFYHSVNVSILALTVGRMVGMSEEQLKVLGLGSLLHDIGKVRVAAAILQHPGRLEQEQWAEIKLHPQEGAETILAAAGPGQEVAAVVAFEHHARFDGNGYPAVHERPSPHFFSRLTTVADTYDAITTRRAYRRAETPHRALNVLLKGTGVQYDPDVVRAFIRMVGVYPPGSLLRLNTGEVVMVTRQGPDPERPMAVLIKTAPPGEVLVDPEPIVVDPEQVMEQLLPSLVGVDPAALLEMVGVEDESWDPHAS
jgi:HD-GYP domain-containing protein (c-di-GMP phosphodiesterase class II)